MQALLSINQEKRITRSYEGAPRTACGQYVTRFMKGYIVTTESDDAPSNMLGEHIKMSDIRQTERRR